MHVTEAEVVMARWLGSRWWLLLIRGIAGILFGVLAFISPGSTLLALVILFGAFALVDGASTLATALSLDREAAPRRGWMIFHGLAGIAAGIVTWVWPDITALALVYVVAAWALVTGIAGIVTAVRLRRQLEREWLLLLSGIISVVLGVLLAVQPAAGAFALTIWIGAFALLFGLLMVVLSLRLRSHERRPGRRIPIQVTPQEV